MSKWANIDALKARIDKDVREDKVLDGWAFFFKVYLDSVPTIERGEAQWIRTRTWYHDGELYCSACGYAPYDERDCGRICGNCGAIMTGDDNG